MLVRAADAGDAHPVDTYTPTIGHDVCQLPNVRYVEGFLPVSLNQPPPSRCPSTPTPPAPTPKQPSSPLP
jgi:hypothetical protein